MIKTTEGHLAHLPVGRDAGMTISHLAFYTDQGIIQVCGLGEGESVNP